MMPTIPIADPARPAHTPAAPLLPKAEIPMFDLLKALYPHRMAPVSPGTDLVNSILLDVLPFQVHHYPTGQELNGWTVPQQWQALKGSIKKDGTLIYDAMAHPLGVIGYSTSFAGEVSLDELKPHLFYHPNFPDALVYHCDYYYKPWRKDWGFSVPYHLYQSLQAGEYQVEVETAFCDDTMKVLDYFLPGDSTDTIILNAHNCHAGQANDDVAGIVVAVEVMRRLQQRSHRRYSYRLIVAPEHFGTVFYLAGLSDETVATFKYAMFLEMLGNNNRLALQASFTGDSLMDRAAQNYLQHHFDDAHFAGFRQVIGNDETVWEAPGYEVPCISVSRCPYPEYHSSRDTVDIIYAEKLEESANAVMGYIDILETNRPMTRHFKGLVALSNPKYDLYISTFDPSLGPDVSKDQRRWNALMDAVIRYFDGKTTVLDIAETHGLEYHAVLEYLRRFEEKGLISFVESTQ